MSEDRAPYGEKALRATANPFFASLIEGRRGEILDAALSVFSEKGYEAGTMREIAALVGVSEPALYRHYSGKEALLVDLVEEAGRHLMTTAKSYLDAAASDDVRGSLKRLLHDRWTLIHSNTGLMRTLMIAAHHNVPAREAMQRTVVRPMADNLREFIKRIDSESGITRSEEDLSTKCRLVMSLLIGHLLTSKFLEQRADEDALVLAMITMMGWYDSEATTLKGD